jgi:hypothetical protein
VKVHRNEARFRREIIRVFNDVSESLMAALKKTDLIVLFPVSFHEPVRIICQHDYSSQNIFRITRRCLFAEIGTVVNNN